MSLWKKKEEIKEEMKENLIEKERVCENPIEVGGDRKIIDIRLSVIVEGGVMFVQREVKITRPVRPADIACVISELEQLKINLLTDYAKGKIMSVNKP